MQVIDIVIDGEISTSRRARQVSSMFDAPSQEKVHLEWHLNLDLDSTPWSVGLIVGPSGAGKSTVMKHVWGEPSVLQWQGAGVIDDFEPQYSVEDIATVCQAVGFNTIPAWMRPYSVLSGGEKFRVELARRLLGDGDPIVVDEFTSVVDRQVAQIGSHAVQKYIRKHNKRFVAVGCHYDVIDWLQPDWILDMATRQFTRRLLRQRPTVECAIGRVSRAAWSMFHPYHYMSADLHPAAQCYGLWVKDTLASFAALLPLPVSNGKHKGEAIARVSRLVTLPDWQGLGLAMVLCDALGGEHSAAGKRLRMYPAHPSLIRAFDRSKNWSLKKEPGTNSRSLSGLQMGGRPCAVFEYCGPVAIQRKLLQ